MVMHRIAAQFECPTGSEGLSVAMIMHLAHAQDYAAAMKYIELQRGMRLLEIGPALGLHMLPIMERGVKCIGLDHSPDMVCAASDCVPGADFICADVCHGKLPRCDAAVSVNSVQWWKQPQMAFCALHEALNPGGPLVVGVMAPLEKSHMFNVGQGRYGVAELTDMMIRGGFTSVVAEAAIVAGRSYIIARGVA